MMKRKRTAPVSFLKIHTLLFTIFVVLMSQSMLATFEYPGNAGVSFQVFQFFIIERVTLIFLWALVLLIHFGIHYIRSGLQRRVVDALDMQRLADHAPDDQEADFYPDARKAKSG